ncbi:MAG TPA: A/G-specific adenine glycosylase [Candidatus Limnocylindrales bacterium]|nr:A/G-specific adenine glycosylase [Candidatus Limnocylindrales bacterium]
MLRPTALPVRAVRRALLAWYTRHGRPLAFRATREPWSVLVSEVMAQQTQVARVEPAWQAFVARFPTPAALAAASPAAALQAWAGLGYNRRALQLQRAAAAIVERHGGLVPEEPGDLERLPGVGPYTARAVAAIAYGRAVGALDTNGRRVLGRVSGAAGETVLRQVADRLVDPDRAADSTHALMDLGATVCRPVPACDACPLRGWCVTGAALAAGKATPVPLRPARRRLTRTAGAGFPATRRWLRGRLVARLRDAAAGEWQHLDGPLGTHPPEAVRAALRDLAAEGMVELDPAGRARLPATAPAATMARP